MNSAQLRRWMRKHGNLGVLMVALYLGVHHLWTQYRRTKLFVVLLLLSLVILLCSHRPPARPAISHMEVQPSSQPQKRLPFSPIDSSQMGFERVALGPPAGADHDYLFNLTVNASNRTLWQDDCLYGHASDVPQNRIVYYANGESDIVARRYGGEELWKCGFRNLRIAHVCAGGEAVFVEESGPTWGVMVEYVEHWEGEEGIVDSLSVSALNSRDGALLWDSTEARVGLPVWTNGKVFLDIRLDVFNPDAGKNDRLPVWLEVRRVKDHKRIWHRLLPGYPSVLSQVSQVDRNHIAF